VKALWAINGTTLHEGHGPQKTTVRNQGIQSFPSKNCNSLSIDKALLGLAGQRDAKKFTLLIATALRVR
jgi:hypothetical protein